MTDSSSTGRSLAIFLSASLAAIAVATWAGSLRAGRKGGGSGMAASSVLGEKPGVFASVCATCHGDRGEGKREMMTPSIASLPRWYVEEQLRKFRVGHRGVVPADVDGQRMRATVMALSEGEIAEAVETLVTLPPVSPGRGLEGGDPENGAFLYESYCMGCHRYNGQGELAFRSAPLAGLQDWYLEAQMRKFNEGIRGAHPEDADGIKMRDAARLPVDDGEILDILSFIAGLAERYPIIKGKTDGE